MSPSLHKLEPDPEHGDLPSCDGWISEGAACAKPAVVHYMYGYYCADHAEQIFADHEADDIRLAITQAQRFLWTARGWGVTWAPLFRNTRKLCAR